MKDGKKLVSRRSFIVGTAAAAGGLAIGVRLPFGSGSAEAQGAAEAGAEVHAWVVVKPDDTCVIRIARSEMGQGTRTGLAQLVAEELECDWKKVATESITPGQNLARQAGLGRDVDGRQPRHPHLAGLRPPRRRGRAHDAAAGGGRSCGRYRSPRSTSLTASSRTRLRAPDDLWQGRGRGREAHAAGSQEHRAQGSEGLEDRRSADEAAGHRRQAQRQPGLCDRRQAAGHAARRDQGVPGVRRQARELRRGEDFRAARRSAAS